VLNAASCRGLLDEGAGKGVKALINLGISGERFPKPVKRGMRVDDSHGWKDFESLRRREK